MGIINYCTTQDVSTILKTLTSTVNRMDAENKLPFGTKRVRMPVEFQEGKRTFIVVLIAEKVEDGFIFTKSSEKALDAMLKSAKAIWN